MKTIPVPAVDHDFHGLPGYWRAFWIGPAENRTCPVLMFCRLRFRVEKRISIPLFVSGDERFQLYLDGEFVGRGPDSGCLERWYYHTFPVKLAPGTHELLALVPGWSLGGEDGPDSRVTFRQGFLLATVEKYSELVSTGLAPWKYALLPFEEYQRHLAVPVMRVRDYLQEAKLLDWQIPHKIGRAVNAFGANSFPLTWKMAPAEVPEMISKPVIPSPCPEEITVPPGESREVRLTFPRYVCVWAGLRLSGAPGATVTFEWAEALQTPSGVKDRTLKGKDSFLEGEGDTFVSNGKKDQCYRPFFWFCGRVLRLVIHNPSREVCRIRDLRFTETHYPIRKESSFHCDDPKAEKVLPILHRTLEMCSHDVFQDCPYYERLTYEGDSRLEALVTLCTSLDDRLVRHALTMFSLSRNELGFTLSRFPSLKHQVIPPYSLFFVNMVQDFALWRNDREFVRGLLPRVREVLNAFANFLSPDGLLCAPPGWNFVDWTGDWPHGVPPMGPCGESGILSRHYELALRDAARLEEYAGIPEFGRYFQKEADALAKAVHKVFYDKKRGLYADDPEHRHFSEHGQALAALSPAVPAAILARLRDGLENAPDLARTTVYFSCYLFEAAGRLGSESLFFDRLDYWYDLKRQGFSTVPERPEPSRSDCHAWGSHPYYHFFATVLGIRPAAPGFARVTIRPMPGPWRHVEGKLPHPEGMIRMKMDREGALWQIQLSLPKGVSGTFSFLGNDTELPPDGKVQKIERRAPESKS